MTHQFTIRTSKSVLRALIAPAVLFLTVMVVGCGRTSLDSSASPLAPSPLSGTASIETGAPEEAAFASNNDSPPVGLLDLDDDDDDEDSDDEDSDDEDSDDEDSDDEDSDDEDSDDEDSDKGKGKDDKDKGKDGVDKGKDGKDKGKDGADRGKDGKDKGKGAKGTDPNPSQGPERLEGTVSSFRGVCPTVTFNLKGTTVVTDATATKYDGGTCATLRPNVQVVVTGTPGTVRRTLRAATITITRTH